MEKIELTKTESHEMEFRQKLINDRLSELNILKSEMGSYANALLNKYNNKGDGKKWTYTNGFLVNISEDSGIENKNGDTVTNQ